MITVSDAFWKFRGHLETTDTEDATASSRQQKLRGQLDDAFDIVTDFLTGAYRRHTKTKPLRDVDIMIVLRDTSYLSMHPHEILEEVRKALAVHYGAARVCTDRRAVRVDFGIGGWMTGEVISFDVVPAFEEGDHYLIPDDRLGIWVSTNPKIHAELATTANKNFDGQWKPLVKMIKKWNQVHGSPAGLQPYELKPFLFKVILDQTEQVGVVFDEYDLFHCGSCPSVTRVLLQQN